MKYLLGRKKQNKKDVFFACLYFCLFHCLGYFLSTPTFTILFPHLTNIFMFALDVHLQMTIILFIKITTSAWISYLSFSLNFGSV